MPTTPTPDQSAQPSALRPVVSNTTPLITLGELGLLFILQTLYSEVWIPQAVFDEYQVGVPIHPLRPDLTTITWITVRKAPTDPAIPPSLDAGETEAIALARSASARLLLIDEQRGRAVAKRFNLPLSGSIGVLLEAKSQALIPLVRPYLDTMNAQGRRTGPQLRKQALQLAGEPDN